MLYTVLIVLHVMICFIIVGVILLQSGKGAEIGAAFGGASQTIFGSRGPGTFLSKVTVVAAVIFMSTSMGLAMLSKERSLFSVTDLEEEAPSAPVTSPPPSSEQDSETLPPPEEIPSDTETGQPSSGPNE